jgi:hypothetical protein
MMIYRCVEAKFRFNHDNHDNIQWSKAYQLARYKQFEEEEKFQVYIILCLGGTPDNPCRMFAVSLRNIDSPELSLDFIAKYETNPNGNFMWRPGSF